MTYRIRKWLWDLWCSGFFFYSNLLPLFFKQALLLHRAGEAAFSPLAPCHLPPRGLTGTVVHLTHVDISKDTHWSSVTKFTCGVAPCIICSFDCVPYSSWWRFQLWLFSLTLLSQQTVLSPIYLSTEAAAWCMLCFMSYTCLNWAVFA